MLARPGIFHFIAGSSPTERSESSSRRQIPPAIVERQLKQQQFRRGQMLASRKKPRCFKEITPLIHRKIAYFSILGAAAAIALVAQQAATEAPAGFTTPTLGQTLSPTGELTATAGSQSVSNGIAEPPGDTFALDQAQFERRHDPSTGLGPLFNATACVECHNNGVAGAASQFTEQRVGHNDA